MSMEHPITRDAKSIVTGNLIIQVKILTILCREVSKNYLFFILTFPSFLGHFNIYDNIHTPLFSFTSTRMDYFDINLLSHNHPNTCLNPYHLTFLLWVHGPIYCERPFDFIGSVTVMTELLVAHGMSFIGIE